MVAAYRDGAVFVVAREGEEARVVDRLLPLPPQHHRLLAVVFALARAASETREGALVSVHPREQIVALVEAVVLPLLCTSTYEKACTSAFFPVVKATS